MRYLIVIKLFCVLCTFHVVAIEKGSCFIPNSFDIDKPNVIVILADDLGYGDIGCYGNSLISTPSLDQIAREGIQFMDFHSNGAVCSPTRAALMTGRYQQRAGITGVITAKEHRTLGLSLSETIIAETLRKAGYTTGIFGKWHLGYASEFNPANQGFDEFIGYVSGNIDYHSHVDQEGYYDWWKSDSYMKQKGYTTDLIAGNAIDFIKRNRKSPFFLFISHEAPHYPYQNRESKLERKPGGMLGRDFSALGSEKDISSVYKEMVEIMDETIGETINVLKQLELDNRTIVIFCSDNGANQHGNNGILKGSKGSVWEGGHRVPAIIRWPGHIQAGIISAEIVLSMDFFPTILELAGIESSKEFDGISIAQHLLDNKSLPKRTVFWQHGDSYAVRDGKWKLIFFRENEPPKLYNLDTDIKEIFDISNKHPDVVSKLVNELKQWKENVFFEGIYKNSN